MLQAIIKKGRAVAEEVPAPLVSKGAVLIKVINSCISAGTELGGIYASGQSLIRRALDQPEKVKKALHMVREVGLSKAYETITGKLESGIASGYSLAGIVIGVGEGVTRFKMGDTVAAAGAGVANHAEFVDVPENLVLPIPHDMNFRDAATVALGSIAMHGVRRAGLHMGEFGVVFGTGILGLLAVRMLSLSGVRVIAVDLDNDRLAVASELGAELAVNPGDSDAVAMVRNFTGGFGADAVLFTAATTSHQPLSLSFQMCKKKGRVVLVGVSGMTLNREDMYPGELDFMISTSYGPGRYDDRYEQKGHDYPYAYVRWTENRNMAEYLRLVYHGQINLEPLFSEVYPIDRVSEAFAALQNPEKRPILVSLDYGQPDLGDLLKLATHSRKVTITSKAVPSDVVRVALVGAGGFATTMHLPNLQKLSDKYALRAVIDRDGHIARSAARQYGAEFTSTDINDILTDENIDLVMICTRHDSHADLTLKALQAGKHVFVEKPLAVSEPELERIRGFYDEFPSSESPPLVMVGFNRRFSRYAREIKHHTIDRINPLMVRYRMNAGYIPPEHWVHENRGRIVGEACHIIDLMTFLTESEVTSVGCDSIKPNNERFSSSDNVAITLAYRDGSLCSIDYFAVGSPDFPKENMEVHFDGKTIVLDDYVALHGYGVRIDAITDSVSQKGQREELECLHETLTGKRKEWPIALWDLLQTTEITLAITG